MVGASAGVLVASCTQQQVDDTAKKLAEIITAIQRGVKEGCAQAGVVIPTANSVIQVIAAMFGGVSPLVLTATQIAQVATAIIEQACAPADAAARRAAKRVVVKGVPVEIY